MPHLPVKANVLLKLSNNAINPNPGVPLPPQVFKEILELASLMIRLGGEKEEALDFSVFLAATSLLIAANAQDFSQNLLTRLGGNGLPANRAMSDADSSVQNAEKVVDFGNRADGRAGVASRRLLSNRNSGA